MLSSNMLKVGNVHHAKQARLDYQKKIKSAGVRHAFALEGQIFAVNYKIMYGLN